MNLPAIMGAAMATAMLGSSTTAAVYDFDLRLQYLGTTYYNVYVIPEDGEDEDYYTSLFETDDVYGIPPLFPGISVGDKVSFNAVLFRPDDADDTQVGTGEGNGGKALSCTIGSFDCSQVDFVMEAIGNQIWFGDDNIIEILGETVPGSWINYSFCPFYFEFDPVLPGYDFEFYEHAFAKFTVLAPIPLPPAALTLPAAVAGLIMMGRRGRSRRVVKGGAAA